MVLQDRHFCSLALISSRASVDTRGNPTQSGYVRVGVEGGGGKELEYWYFCKLDTGSDQR